MNKEYIYVVFDKTDMFYNQPFVALCTMKEEAERLVQERRNQLEKHAQRYVYWDQYKTNQWVCGR